MRDVLISGKFSTNQGAALRMAALSGAGIVLQPELLLAADIAEGRLEQVLPEWSYKPVPMSLVYAPNPPADSDAADGDRFPGGTVWLVKLGRGRRPLQCGGL